MDDRTRGDLLYHLDSARASLRSAKDAVGNAPPVTHQGSGVEAAAWTFRMLCTQENVPRRYTAKITSDLVAHLLTRCGVGHVFKGIGSLPELVEQAIAKES